MICLKRDSLLRVTESLIEEANGMTVTLPAGDYRAEPVGMNADNRHDQYLLVSQGRVRAHAVSGELLQDLDG